MKKTYKVEITKTVLDIFELELTEQQLNELNSITDLFDRETYVKQLAYSGYGEDEIKSIKVNLKVEEANEAD